MTRTGHLQADAWVLGPGDGAASPTPAELRRETIELSPLSPDEVLAEPLYGCWEGNMSHALDRRPVDICRQRGEARVVIGNAASLRIVETGAAVRNVRVGDNAILFCNGEEDRWGYPKKILGYDAPGAQGCLATRMKLKDRQVIPIPEGTRHSLQQWAAFSLRYITAWSNWELARGVFRLLVSAGECPAPHVWGWGGGTTHALLHLAHLQGFRAAMLSGSDLHLQEIARSGLTPVDRRKFGDLNFDEARYRSNANYRATYQTSERAFLAEVQRLTQGEMVQIFADFVGSPVHRLTLKALSREGVLTTAGWKEGMEIRNLRAIECIERHQHVHTHYARYVQGVEGVEYAERNGWLPEVDGKVYSFDSIPELIADYRAGRAGYYPCYAINATP